MVAGPDRAFAFDAAAVARIGRQSDHVGVELMIAAIVKSQFRRFLAQPAAVNTLPLDLVDVPAQLPIPIQTRNHRPGEIDES